MTWQDDVIQKVNLDGSFVYIVNDPDGLLFEPKISSALQKKMQFYLMTRILSHFD